MRESSGGPLPLILFFAPTVRKIDNALGAFQPSRSAFEQVGGVAAWAAGRARHRLQLVLLLVAISPRSVRSVFPFTNTQTHRFALSR